MQLRKARAAQKPAERKATGELETTIYHLLPPEKDQKANSTPPADLQELIVKLIEPKSWAEQRDVYVKVLPQAVVVRHRPSVQWRVEGLLRSLGLNAVGQDIDRAIDGSRGPEVRGGGFF